MIRLQNPFRKIQVKYWQGQAEKEYQEFEDTYEFIWGIKSHDCLTEAEANLHTMNDIDITYNKKDKTYSLSIETIYEFKTGSDGERGYILSLFDAMTKWMQEQGYKTDVQPWICSVFTDGYNINTKFKSIEELYTTFKCLVKGFCANP